MKLHYRLDGRWLQAGAGFDPLLRRGDDVGRNAIHDMFGVVRGLGQPQQGSRILFNQRCKGDFSKIRDNFPMQAVGRVIFLIQLIQHTERIGHRRGKCPFDHEQNVFSEPANLEARVIEGDRRRRQDCGIQKSWRHEFRLGQRTVGHNPFHESGDLRGEANK